MIRSLLSILGIERVLRHFLDQIQQVTPQPDNIDKPDAAADDARATKLSEAKRLIIALAEALARQAARDDDARERGDGGARSVIQRKL